MKIARYLCAASIIALPVAAYAQQITSSIEGLVTDAGGVPVVGARVDVTDTRTGNVRSFTTDTAGRFAARGLTVGGPYTVTAGADGLQGQTVEGLITSLQGATTLSFALDRAATETAERAIVVTGTRVNVQLRDIGPGTAFGSTMIENAPTFNRDVRDIVRIDPRVSLDRDDGGSGQDRISCLGGNDRGNTFTVDGIIQGDVYGLNDTGFSSRSSTPLPYDAVRETQVQFAPFDVEHGQFTGCAINVVTRSGGNRFTGGAFYEYSDNGLRGDSVTAAGTTRPVAPIEPDRRWGAFLGGPIIPNRLFFFAAYERQEAGQSQDDGPTGAGYANPINAISVAQFNQVADILRNTYGIDPGPLVTNRPFVNERWFGRLDWQINDDHRLELTYQRLREGTTRPDDFFIDQASPQITGQNTFYVSGTRSEYYSGRLYSQWTDRFSTELRYSRSNVTDRQDPVGGGEAQSANPIPRIIVGIDNPGVEDGTILAGPGNSRSANDLRTNIQQYRALANLEAGNHSFKLGFEWNRARIFNLFVQNATGTLVFQNIADLQAGLLSLGTGNNQTGTFPNQVISGQTEGAFGNFSATGDVNDAAARFTRSIYSAYLQDDWTVNDSLDIVAGVRVDWYGGGRPNANPAYALRYGFPNTTGFNDLDPVVLPRLGFSWRFDDFGPISRGLLRGGIGIFSGGDPLVWFGNAFQNDGRGFATGTSQAAGCPAGQIDVVVGGTFTGVPTCIRANAIAQAAAGLGDAQSIDPDIEQPTVLRINLGLQGEIGFASGFFSGWRFNLDYIYSRYMNPYTIVDLSQTPAIAGVAGAGLNGFTIDGRPIYRAIDPTVAGCTAQLVDAGAPPVWANVNAPCFNTGRDDELMLTNSGGYRTHVASFLLSRDFGSGIFTSGGRVSVNMGYSYTNAQDRRNMYNSTAGSNYDLTAAFDRQNPAASRGFFESRHNITFSALFRERFFGEYDTSLGFTFVARSGRPYSLTWTGGSVFNDSASGNNNALLYVPTGVNDPAIAPTSNAAAVQQLVDYVNATPCARRYAGQTIPRNTCTNDWYYDLDLTFSQELPGPGRLIGMNDTIRLFATFDNFLNFLDDSWNVQRRRNFAGLQNVATLGSIDAQGRYVVTAGRTQAQIDSDNTINVSSSVWRVKVGISWRF
ncbi:MAG: carboxypeptidase regulatory-like domain-containing protein [Sphingomonas sp.]